MAKIISICNRKGGVGKTVTAVNLSAYLAALGKYVLLVDIDPQANATSSFGIVPDNLDKSIYHSLIGQIYPEEIIKSTKIFGCHLLPSSFDLAGATVELIELEDREYNLLKNLDSIRIKYDYVIIDCPPSLELLTINGLVASDEVIIPIQCDYYSLDGLNQLLKAIDLIRRNLRSELRVRGILLTMYDKKVKLAKYVKEKVQKQYFGRVFRTIIPKDHKLAEAPGLGKTILQHDHKSEGAKAYFQLAKELIATEKDYNLKF